MISPDALIARGIKRFDLCGFLSPFYWRETVGPKISRNKGKASIFHRGVARYRWGRLLNLSTDDEENKKGRKEEVSNISENCAHPINSGAGRRVWLPYSGCIVRILFVINGQRGLVRFLFLFCFFFIYCILRFSQGPFCTRSPFLFASLLYALCYWLCRLRNRLLKLKILRKK